MRRLFLVSALGFGLAMLVPTVADADGGRYRDRHGGWHHDHRDGGRHFRHHDGFRRDAFRRHRDFDRRARSRHGWQRGFDRDCDDRGRRFGRSRVYTGRYPDWTGYRYRSGGTPLGHGFRWRFRD